jgi:hypothetical protein
LLILLAYGILNLVRTTYSEVVLDVLVETHNEKKKGDTKDHPQVQWFLKHSDLDELARLKAARQQVHK